MTMKQKNPRKWNKALVIAGVALSSVIVTPLALVGLIQAAGFGAIGIAAGSLGALMMSASTTWWGGLLGPLVAILQSIGAKASVGAWVCGSILLYFWLQTLTPPLGGSNETATS